VFGVSLWRVGKKATPELKDHCLVTVLREGRRRPRALISKREGVLRLSPPEKWEGGTHIMDLLLAGKKKNRDVSKLKRGEGEKEKCSCRRGNYRDHEGIERCSNPRALTRVGKRGEETFKL